MSLIGIHISHIDDIIKIINKDNHFKNIDLIQIFVNATINYSDKKYINVLNFLKKKR